MERRVPVLCLVMSTRLSFVRLLLAFGFMSWTVATAEAQTVSADPARFAADIQVFREADTSIPAPTDAVVFVGSSTIRMWPTAERFPDLPLINRGFGGSQISDVNHYIEDVVLKYRPAVIVFYAGDNDINAGKTPEQVASDYREFVVKVLAARADTRIIYLPIKPSIARWKLWPTMQDANARIRSYGEGRNAERPGAPTMFYVDVATPMLTNDGQTQAHLYLEDGLHMTPAGYDLWTRLLAPVIEQARTAR
jgi:lysophospholipase L1-like esterase